MVVESGNWGYLWSRSPNHYRKLAISLSSWSFLDPVSLLKVYQPISKTTKRLCIATKPFPPQVLANQIDNAGEGAEAVILLNMELQVFFVHAKSMPWAS
jgi:hypothetical protein